MNMGDGYHMGLPRTPKNIITGMTVVFAKAMNSCLESSFNPMGAWGHIKLNLVVFGVGT